MSPKLLQDIHTIESGYIKNRRQTDDGLFMNYYNTYSASNPRIVRKAALYNTYLEIAVTYNDLLKNATSISEYLNALEKYDKLCDFMVTSLDAKTNELEKQLKKAITNDERKMVLLSSIQNINN